MTSLIRAGAALAVLALLGACQTTGGPLVEVTPGESRVEAELARQKANRDFRIDSVAPGRIRLIARARPVVIEPAEGLCLSPEATELTERGVFAVVADCLPPGGAAAFPGLITVSVAAEPMYPSGPGRKRELRRMRDFLGTAPGLAMLARGSGETGVRLEDVRAIDEGLYVHVHETGTAEDALFAPGFWRALLEINDRLVLVTVSGLAGGGLDEEAMLAVLATQVARLKTANGQRPVEAELRLARAAGAALPGAAPPTGAAAPVGDDRSDARQLARTPLPAARGAAAGDGATARAPARGPVAPRRPSTGV